MTIVLELLKQEQKVYTILIKKDMLDFLKNFFNLNTSQSKGNSNKRKIWCVLKVKHGLGRLYFVDFGDK